VESGGQLTYPYIIKCVFTPWRHTWAHGRGNRWNSEYSFMMVAPCEKWSSTREHDIEKVGTELQGGFIGLMEAGISGIPSFLFLQ
jgi:hypothetical protein